ncbi:tRNA1(Val) (adenine(37)-N6)-methyltransferase [Profundibacter sp.]|uniref:tRNA1(Val) (adenine(37)-N6)-methyltransferase n=1 Tax=Profundibacter sp. TaxID=3101071 RepID=UPI003D0A8DEC
MGFAETDLTHDRFLDGKLHIWQPKTGYHAGVDPVLLAATVPAIAGDSVLELGCGVGVASLCLSARVSGLDLTGVEVQPDYAELAQRNAGENGHKMAVQCANLRALPDAVLQCNYDHVIANPPYYLRNCGTAATDAGRETALGEATPLADWIDAATRRLKPKGHLTVIQDAERLPALLGALDDRLGSIRVLPLAPRVGRPAHLVILQARKGGRAAFRLLAPAVMHEGAVHDGDRESYTPEIRAVLRNGDALVLESR